MKILHTADWHIGKFRSPVKDGVNIRSEDTKHCLDELVRVAGEERPDYSLVSGDIFDVGSIHSDRCCEEIITAAHYIRELAVVSGMVVVMRGTPNHDGMGQFNVLAEMFAGSGNVHIITTPQVLRAADADIAVVPGFDRGEYRARFPGIPKEEEHEVFTRELGNIILGLRSQCRPGRPCVLMTHYTVPGCSLEGGQSMLLTQFEPVITQEILLAAGYDLVALGHIHRPQRISSQMWYYSGAINAMNFKDEGQERGFWIHTSTPSGAWDSVFHRTPAREFVTLEFSDMDITEINHGNLDAVALTHWRMNGAVQDRIVRIHYSCTTENEKAYRMKDALVEKVLLDDGTFMLWENLPDRIEQAVNRTGLDDVTDPEGNLVRYLEEKQVQPARIQELVCRARPVIAAAQAGMPMAAHTGVLEPVEISVTNYRNYEEETFRFGDISFCTINGPNGAGKSSLFMDAIIDCLYEQPREGFLKDATGKPSWLRNDDRVRGGSIMFTFRLGNREYRVTRTRQRSGGGTLNLSECVDGTWQNRSRERQDDTQKEIRNLIGMDSFTFKSCALIMQDQYGIFLQAKPEERVEVLGTLLGLGVYQAMERIAHESVKTNGAKARELEQRIEIHQGTISGLGNPEEKLVACQKDLAVYESSLEEKTADRDKYRLLLVNQQEARERRDKLLEEISILGTKLDAVGRNRDTQQAIIDNCAVILGRRQEIETKAAEHASLMERERQLAGESALYSSKKRETEGFARQAASEQKAIDAYKARVKQKETELSWIQPTDQDAVIRENAAEYERQKKLLDEAYEEDRAYRAVEQKLVQARYSLRQAATQYESEVRHLQSAEEGMQKKAELLSTVDCVDISQAKCGFLADAIAAKQTLVDYPGYYLALEKAYGEQMAPLNQQIAELEEQMAGLSFDDGKICAVTKKIADLEPYVEKLEAISQRDGRIALLKADLEHLQSNILESEKRLAEAELKATEAGRERDQYATAFTEHVRVMGEIVALEPWLEKERQIPIAEERSATAMDRILELDAELAEINAEIARKQAGADKEILAMSGMEEIAGIVAGKQAEVDLARLKVKEKQMEAGALQQASVQVSMLKKEIVGLQEKQMEYAAEAADYEALKAAFSQGGIPHQIIRSIIPRLTDISNTILGQMTGGKMGVEYRLEKPLKRGSEKASLDIYIEEHGKPSLPYLSKSGGEKVKSSLAVILALAEIKSSVAGIQLGFLQIDEPPFLDSEGTHAYVDALETIQQRYHGLKVMAITHDQEFKARFPQSITVYKDERGSHVRWD